MSFITLTITCDEEKREFLIAELSLFPFDAFEETETGLLASCEKDGYEPEEVKEVLDRYKVEYQVEEVEKVNWNEEWEKNFSPIIVDELCQVRAPFHPKLETEFDIVIEPKMSLVPDITRPRI